MGGFFAIASKEDCVNDLFYGTDYHSHLGTKRGGLAVKNPEGLTRYIHDITNTPFRTKFEIDVQKMHGHLGIGVISDYDDQPVVIRSHLGGYSIVRGTQLRDTIQRLYDYGAVEVHMRPACPPLVYGCKFLNFSRSKSELDLAARKAIKELEGSENEHLDVYARPDTDKYAAMIERIEQSLRLTSLKYQHLDDLVTAIGLPKEKLCTFCWDGAE